MNGMGTEIINADYVERFLLVQKEDAVLINANMPSKPVVIGRYAERKEAEAAMAELLDALSEKNTFLMREDTGPYMPPKKQPRYHGGKPIRRGGS